MNSLEYQCLVEKLDKIQSDVDEIGDRLTKLELGLSLKINTLETKMKIFWGGGGAVALVAITALISSIWK